MATCLLIGVAGLTLCGCGDDGAATVESTVAAKPARKDPPPTIANRPCPTAVDTLVDSLERLRRQLAVGLSYEQYAARIKALRASYDAIPLDHLTIGCLATTGTPAEQAFNKYIDAANAWGACLADASCTTATIEPVLQRKWQVASRLLSRAQS